jgi:hypothetical protein
MRQYFRESRAGEVLNMAVTEASLAPECHSRDLLRRDAEKCVRGPHPSSALGAYRRSLGRSRVVADRPTLRPYDASPTVEARAKVRGRRSSVARSRLRPVGADNGRIHPSEPDTFKRPFSNASDVDASRPQHHHGPGAGVHGKSTSSALGAVASMCSSTSHEWDTHTFGATYPASAETPASPTRF